MRPESSRRKCLLSIIFIVGKYQSRCSDDGGSPMPARYGNHAFNLDVETAHSLREI